MGFTVQQVRAQFPDAQFCGGKAVIRNELGKAVELGQVMAGGEFIPSMQGINLLQSVVAPVEKEPEVAQEKPKRRSRVSTDYSVGNTLAAVLDE